MQITFLLFCAKMTAPFLSQTSGIWTIAGRAYGFSILQMDIIFGNPFAADSTGTASENARFFRHLFRGSFHREHFVTVAVHKPGKPFGLCFLRGGAQYQAERGSVAAAVKRKSIFSLHMENKISFSDSASGEHLNGIDATGIGFCHADKFFILAAALSAQQLP